MSSAFDDVIGDDSGESDSDSKPYNSESNAGDEWGTPPWIVRPLADALGGFDLDPASGAEPEPYAEMRYTVEDNGLEQDWFGDVWLNPPYGRTENPTWGERAYEQAHTDRVDTLTALVPASTETNWFQDYYFTADYITFFDQRIQFIGAGDHGASFPNVIASFGDFPEGYFEVLHDFGVVVEVLGEG